jgi:hypothetical protein
MRAREFLREAEPNLADALRAAAEQQKAAQQPKIGQQTNPNAVQQPAGTQGTQSSTAPAQTQPAGAKKPLGIGAAFAAGLTKGKSQQIDPNTGEPMGLGGVAKQGAKNFAANQLGMKGTVSALSGQQPEPIEDPTELGMAFKPGQTIDLPNVGKIKVTKSGPQGIELDTSQAAAIGLPKLTLNPRDLLQK